MGSLYQPWCYSSRHQIGKRYGCLVLRSLVLFCGCPVLSCLSCLALSCFVLWGSCLVLTWDGPTNPNPNPNLSNPYPNLNPNPNTNSSPNTNLSPNNNPKLEKADDFGSAKLIDFGVAKPLENESKGLFILNPKPNPSSDSDSQPETLTLTLRPRPWPWPWDPDPDPDPDHETLTLGSWRRCCSWGLPSVLGLAVGSCSLVLSCLVLSCLVFFCLVLLVFFCLVLSCLDLSCLDLFFFLTCLALTCLVLGFLVLACLVLACFVFCHFFCNYCLVCLREGAFLLGNGPFLVGQMWDCFCMYSVMPR